MRNTPRKILVKEQSCFIFLAFALLKKGDRLAVKVTEKAVKNLPFSKALREQRVTKIPSTFFRNSCPGGNYG